MINWTYGSIFLETLLLEIGDGGNLPLLSGLLLFDVELHLVEYFHFLSSTLLIEYLLAPLEQVGISRHIKLFDLFLRNGLAGSLRSIIGVVSVASSVALVSSGSSFLIAVDLLAITVATHETPGGFCQVALGRLRIWLRERVREKKGNWRRCDLRLIPSHFRYPMSNLCSNCSCLL